MRSIRTSRSPTALSVMILAAAATLFVGVQRGSAQTEAVSSEVPRIDAARYDSDGRLLFPEDAHRWIPIGASLGSDYDDQAFDPASPGPIGVVQIEPSAYDYFQSNGRYADGTMLLLTFYAVQEKPAPALNGFVQDDVLQREIHVIDRQRFTDEGRAFFLFPGATSAVAAPFPSGSACVECHTAHGDVDGTFVQFYPALR